MLNVAPATFSKPISKRDRNNRRMVQLRQLRSKHEHHWQEIRDFIAPDLYEDPVAAPANEGQRRDSAIVNNTPTLALEIAVSGLFNGTCDPTEEWLDLEAADPALNKIHGVRVYFDEVRSRILTELARSNFYKQVTEDFASLLAFGTCATVMKESWNTESVVSFQSLPTGSYYVANNSDREVVEIARDLKMTTGQMVELFGDRCSRQVKDAYANGSVHQEIDVCHMVYPNPAHNPMQDAMPHQKAWLSCYYEPMSTGDATGDVMLEESGFAVFPVACARWNTLGSNPYGFGPGRKSVGDSRALQAMEVDTATAVELQVKPPLLVPEGMAGQEISLIPGSLNYAIGADGNQAVRPLMQVNHDIADARGAINEHEERIRSAFYNDIFLMIANDEGGKMTAREVMERAREKRLALTPILRVTQEYHKPIVRFVFSVLARRGRLPEPPPELAGQEIKIAFRSVLAQSAELERSQATRSAVANAVQVAVETQRADILDNIDFDEAVRDDFRKSGAPAAVLLDPAKVEGIRATRAQQIARQQQGEAAAQAAQTAQTLSQTPTGGKTALTDILAGLQQ